MDCMTLGTQQQHSTETTSAETINKSSTNWIAYPQDQFFSGHACMPLHHLVPCYSVAFPYGTRVATLQGVSAQSSATQRANHGQQPQRRPEASNCQRGVHPRPAHRWFKCELGELGNAPIHNPRVRVHHIILGGAGGHLDLQVRDLLLLLLVRNFDRAWDRRCEDQRPELTRQRRCLSYP